MLKIGKWLTVSHCDKYEPALGDLDRVPQYSPKEARPKLVGSITAETLGN